MRKLLFAILLVTACASSAYAEDYWVYIKQADEIAGTDRIAGLSQKGDIVDVIPCSRSTGTPATPGYFIIKVSGITEAQRNEMLKPYTETTMVDGRQVVKTLAYRKSSINLNTFKATQSIGSKVSVVTTAVTADKIAPVEKTAATLEAYQKEARLYDMTMPVRVAKKTILDLILPQARAASLVRYVNTASSGGDGTTNNTSGATAAFATLNVAEDTMDGDLTDSGGDTLTINCAGTSADTTAVDVAGWTTSASCYVNVVGNMTDGKWDTSKYKLQVTNDTVIAINGCDYIRFDRLQLKGICNYDYGGRNLISCYTTGNTGRIDISNVIGWATDTGTNTNRQGIFIYPDHDVVFNIFNTVLYRSGGGTGAWGAICGYTNQVNVYSCTLVGNWEYGLNRMGGTWVAKNCYANATGDCYYGSITLTTCASSDATGSAGLTNVATSTSSGAYFVNVTAGSEDYHIGSSSTLKDAGTDTSGESAPLNFTTDIDGVTRSGTWDIGADEYVAAGGGASAQPPTDRSIGHGIMRGVF